MSRYFWRLYYYWFPAITVHDYILQINRCNDPIKFPHIAYYKYGKFYTVWLKDEESYCERYDDKIDVYKSCKTGKVTGYKLYE